MWANPTNMSLFEAFRDDYKDEDLHLGAQMMPVG